jgi:hypothetical protein
MRGLYAQKRIVWVLRWAIVGRQLRQREEGLESRRRPMDGQQYRAGSENRLQNDLPLVRRPIESARSLALTAPRPRNTPYSGRECSATRSWRKPVPEPRLCEANTEHDHGDYRDSGDKESPLSPLPPRNAEPHGAKSSTSGGPMVKAR